MASMAEGHDLIEYMNDLRRIVYELNHARDLDQVMSVIVQRLNKMTGCDACMIYLTDETSGFHVLHAAYGINPSLVGQLRIQSGVGLVSMVVERVLPVHLEDATTHPKFEKSFGGSEEFHGFLGVPVVLNHRTLGALVLRSREIRLFDEQDLTLVAVLAAQLAGVVAQAHETGEIERMMHGSVPRRFFTGHPASPGIGIGEVVLAVAPIELDDVSDQVPEDIETEIEAFLAAIEKVKFDLKKAANGFDKEHQTDSIAIFDAWAMMLDSDIFTSGTIERIRAGNHAPGALRDNLTEQINVFESMKDPYLRERATDIRDLGRSVLVHLLNHSDIPDKFPANTVLVGQELTVLQLSKIPQQQLIGIVSATGSSTSHVGILARTLGIPAVMGLRDLPFTRMDGQEVIVDGTRGRFYLSPGPAVKNEFQRLMEEDGKLTAELEALSNLPAITKDGAQMALMLNMGMLSEQEKAALHYADGIGLYRTELPFMVRDALPGEAEQTTFYRNILTIADSHPVVMRTLDVGGDKPLPSLTTYEEENPFLGWRGVRIAVEHPEILLTQLRGMLKAAIGLNNLRIMFPMISTAAETSQAIELTRRAYEELRVEGFEVVMPKIGVMIEVPSAIYQLDKIASQVQFLSIGTNDLTQYLLAVDRNNSRVAYLYDAFHPAIIKAMKMVVEGARRFDIEVCVCGELAGESLATLLFLGLGVNMLSMSARSLPRVKHVIRNVSVELAREALAEALECRDGDEVRKVLKKHLNRLGLTSLTI